MALEARSRDLGHRRACAAADSLAAESTLLRANPPKGGDAELRGYRGRRPPRLPGRQRPTRVDVGGPVSFWDRSRARHDLQAQAGPPARITQRPWMAAPVAVRVVVSPQSVTLQDNQRTRLTVKLRRAVS